MTVSMIVAAAKNGAIGFENNLLWHLPDDFRRFKRITSGHPIIMGRKTFESLGKPLSNRPNIVITRNPEFNPEGTLVVASLEEALKKAEEIAGEGEVFVIGGGEIYKQAFPVTSKIYLTEVNATPEADAFFVINDPENWEEESRTHHGADDRHQYAFDYIDLVRKS